MPRASIYSYEIIVSFQCCIFFIIMTIIKVIITRNDIISALNTISITSLEIFDTINNVQY